MFDNIKYHRYVVWVVFTLMATGVAYAQETAPPPTTQSRAVVCPEQLTPEQCNELEAQALKMIAEKAPFADSLKDIAKKENLLTAKEYMGIGKEIGQAIGATAKELGIAANDFAKSDLGWWTLVIILFYIFGSTIKAYFAVAVFLAVGIPVWLKIWRGVNYYKWIETKDETGKTIAREWRVDTEAIPKDSTYRNKQADGVAVGKFVVNAAAAVSLLVVLLILA